MFEAQIKQTEPMTVAYVMMHGPYAQAPEGYQRLYEWVGHYGLQPAGMPEAIYLTMPDTTPEPQAEWELWAPIAGGPGETRPEDDGIGVKRVAEETVASVTHQGPYDSIAPTYAKLAQWIEDNGYVVVGPPREIYLTDPQEAPPEEYLTEVQFPVQRAS